MPFIKKGSAEIVRPIGEPIVATPVAGTFPEVYKNPKGRDFDAEARGKTRCALEEAWAQSPLLPMLVKDPNDRAELHLILDEIVTERMKRVFPNG